MTRDRRGIIGSRDTHRAEDWVTVQQTIVDNKADGAFANIRMAGIEVYIGHSLQRGLVISYSCRTCQCQHPGGRIPICGRTVRKIRESQFIFTALITAADGNPGAGKIYVFDV